MGRVTSDEPGYESVLSGSLEIYCRISRLAGLLDIDGKSPLTYGLDSQESESHLYSLNAMRP